MTATRVTPGAISLSSSSHFPLMPYSNMGKAGGIAARPRQAVDKAGADRIETPRTRSARCGSPVAMPPRSGAPCGQNDIRRERDQFRRVSAKSVGIAAAQRVSIRTLRPIGPAQLLQALHEAVDAGLPFRIVCRRA